METTRSVVQISTRRGTSEYELINHKNTRAYPVATDAERAWSGLPAIYASLDIRDSGVLNPDDRLYGRQNLRLYRRLGERRLSHLVNCGSTLAGDADSYEVTMSVLTMVTPAGAGSVVRSWVQASGRPQGMSSTPVNCVSTGRLEREIAQLLNEQAAQ
ncbi:MAG TPA: hypothetical protein VF746_26685 [Longimicrobium sp.]|jgi:hypothetical protein